jgi:hypothetical protein
MYALSGKRPPVMRFAKRRDPSRRAIKPDTTIIFEPTAGNWRERLKALKAAQQAEQVRDGCVPSKQERQ